MTIAALAGAGAAWAHSSGRLGVCSQSWLDKSDYARFIQTIVIYAGGFRLPSERQHLPHQRCHIRHQETGTYQEVQHLAPGPSRSIVTITWLPNPVQSLLMKSLLPDQDIANVVHVQCGVSRRTMHPLREHRLLCNRCSLPPPGLEALASTWWLPDAA